MSASRTRAVGAFLGLLLSASLVIPAGAAARSCITNLVGNVCLAQCIGTLQQSCGSDVACHQTIVDALQALASTPDETPACDAAVSAALAACDCE